EGDRFVVERNGDFYVRKDDSFLFRDGDVVVDYEQLPRGLVREVVTRPNGVQIITVRDAGGYVLRRVRQSPNGDRVVLFDIRDGDRVEFIDYDRQLPPLRVRRPLDDYIVSARRADRRLFYNTFASEPVEQVQTGYSLQSIRDNERLRSTVSRIDLDTVEFASGSSFVTSSQVRLLGDIAGAMLDVIEQNPAAVFLIEGHTDAVGSELSNLTLSDRRAESVAQILVEYYRVPPENLVTQGYGEQFLKVNTQTASQANRRVTVRNISPILYSGN
ncbi:MAG: OmpA family protein, partial [Pseudomonadota bacterium]